MGYRHYMYLIEKETVDAIKGLSTPQLKEYFKSDADEYPDLDCIHGKCIFGFGKLYHCDTAERIYSKGSPLFDNKEVMDNYSDYVPHVVGKEGLIEAIKIYEEKVKAVLANKTINDGDLKPSLTGPFGIEIPLPKDKYQTAEQKSLEYIKDKKEYWDEGRVLDMNEHSNHVTSSWYYEYATFNLVALLKTIDFNKYTILFYGS